MSGFGMSNPSLPGPRGRRPGRRPGDLAIEKIKKSIKKIIQVPKTRAPRRRKSPR